MSAKSNYFGDRKLLIRVREFVREFKGIRLSSDEIAERLQIQYSEYGRKKKNTFAKSVEKAHNIVIKERGNDLTNIEDSYLQRHKKKQDKEDPDTSNSLSEEEKSFSSDCEVYVEYKDANGVNNMMTNVYNKTDAKKEKKTDGENDLFFIDKGGSFKGGKEQFTKYSPATSKKKQNVNDHDIHNQDTPTKRIGELIIIENEENTENTPARSVRKQATSEDEKSVKSVSKKRKREKNSKPETEEKRKKGPELQTSSVTFADFGGNEERLMEVCKLLVHMKHPEVYKQLGVTPPQGFLLHGPPGCGKTLLAHAIAGELGLPFIKVAGPEMVSGVSGDSEEKLRDLFEKAIMAAPCILFMDEIDAITQKRETASKDMERRIVAQLLTCMDDLTSKENTHVLVIGATNRPDSLDPALRRTGRFDREISLGIPDEKARNKILCVLCRNLKLNEGFDLGNLAKMTPGYVGSDLKALTCEAAMTAVNRVVNSIQSCTSTDSNAMETTETSMEITDTRSPVVSTSISGTPSQTLTSELNLMLSWLKDHPPLTTEQLEVLSITTDDFSEALKNVQPSAKREGFATIPDVTWEDIGALHSVREDLQLAILAPVRHSEQFESLGLAKAQGILLAGPPGCGKTLLAKAVANESGINFISVKGPELLNMYVGESEKAVRQVFQRARNSSPCVIFFDELDALCPRRSDGGEGGSSVRVVNQLLTEMDGLEERKQVYIMAATNRPDIIDPAVLRPGRLDKTIYVGLPTQDDKLDILMTITKKGTKPLLADDVHLEEIANDVRCQSYTGADLAALVREASVNALKVIIKDTTSVCPNLQVTKDNFEQAFARIRPSVSQRDLLQYDKMKKNLSIT